MPIATSVASASPLTVAPRPEPPPQQAQREVGRREAEENEPGPAEPPGQGRLQIECLCQRFEPEEREQPSGQRHEGRQPLGAHLAQRREPGQAEGHGEDADEETDHCEAEEPLAGRAGRLDRRGDLLGRLDSRRARDADRDRLVLDPVVLDDDRRGAQVAKRTVTVDRERDDRVVDGHQADRQILTLGVRDADLDLARLELHAPDVELVGGRRVAPEQVEERVARRREERDGADEDEQRHERPEAPAVTAGREPPPRPPTPPRRSPSSRARRTRSGGRGT